MSIEQIFKIYKGNRLEIGTQQKDVISVIVNKHQTFTLLEKTSILKIFKVH